MIFYINSLFAFLVATTSSADAFCTSASLDLGSLPWHLNSSRCKLTTSALPRRATAMLKMSDFDFPSAMPEKPTQTMEEKLQESATQFIADITSRLGEGVEAPPEIEALREARDAEAVDVQTLSLRIYELMIEQGMLYDRDAETGIFTPTQFDIKNNLDIPEVKAEFDHLYKYGMELIRRGMIDVDKVKETVMERLIKRTGLTPEEFDKWLGY